MAYTPINWQTGDTITADKLNKMDNGWSYDAGGTRELFSETVTTAVDPEFPDSPPYVSLSYGQQIDANAITVTFDGTAYECPRNADESYGATWSDELNSYDFSEFPFGLDGYGITTQTAGEHTVTVVANVAPSAEVSEQFVAAVGATGLLPFSCVAGVTTYAEMRAAADAGRLLYFYRGRNFHLVIGFNNEASGTAVTAYPEGTVGAETYGFDSNMVFTVFYY